MTNLGICLLIVLALCGCGGSPTAPDVVQRPPESVDVATISGRIYVGGGAVQNPIAGASVEINEADGTSATVVSDAEGFYRMTARRGSVTVTASKAGYEAKEWQFDLLSDTVLNFSLSPE